MRRLVILVLSVAVLWCAWWAAASYALQKGAATWLEDRRAAGWQAQADVTQLGFPLHLRSVAKDVSLADPVNRNGMKAERVTLSAPAYWPGFINLDLPETPMTITLSGQQFRLRAQGASAGIRLHPGMALQLENVTARSGAWLLSTARGALLSGDDLTVTVQQDASAETLYTFDLGAGALTPGDALRSTFALPQDWPRAFDSVDVRGAIGFDRALDRDASTHPLPQPRSMALHALDLRWGDLAISGKGAVTISETGVPTGHLTLGLAQWQTTLDLVAQSGLLDPAQRNQAQLVMGGLANIGGADGDLELTLSFADGQMSLGAIQLGPAPRIVLR